MADLTEPLQVTLMAAPALAEDRSDKHIGHRRLGLSRHSLNIVSDSTYKYDVPSDSLLPCQLL